MGDLIQFIPRARSQTLLESKEAEAAAFLESHPHLAVSSGHKIVDGLREAIARESIPYAGKGIDGMNLGDETGTGVETKL